MFQLGWYNQASAKPLRRFWLPGSRQAACHPTHPFYSSSDIISTVYRVQGLICFGYILERIPQRELWSICISAVTVVKDVPGRHQPHGEAAQPMS